MLRGAMGVVGECIEDAAVADLAMAACRHHAGKLGPEQRQAGDLVLDRLQMLARLPHDLGGGSMARRISGA